MSSQTSLKMSLRSSKFMDLMIGRLEPLTNISWKTPPLTSSNHHFTLITKILAFFWISHICVIIQYCFCYWLIFLLSVITSRSIHVVASGNSSFFLKINCDWFKMFCQFLLYSKVYIHIYIYILFLTLSSIMFHYRWLDI